VQFGSGLQHGHEVDQRYASKIELDFNAYNSMGRSFRGYFVKYAFRVVRTFGGSERSSGEGLQEVQSRGLSVLLDMDLRVGSSKL
jgi:hypothetical protein